MLPAPESEVAEIDTLIGQPMLIGHPTSRQSAGEWETASLALTKRTVCRATISSTSVINRSPNGNRITRPRISLSRLPALGGSDDLVSLPDTPRHTCHTKSTSTRIDAIAAKTLIHRCSRSGTVLATTITRIIVTNAPSMGRIRYLMRYPFQLILWFFRIEHVNNNRSDVLYHLVSGRVAHPSSFFSFHLPHRGCPILYTVKGGIDSVPILTGPSSASE